MKPKNLSRQQIHNACQVNKYIVLRYSKSNRCIAINCKVSKHRKLSDKLAKKPHKKTNFISFRPCCFMEYISLKTPFL